MRIVWGTWMLIKHLQWKIRPSVFLCVWPKEGAFAFSVAD